MSDSLHAPASQVYVSAVMPCLNEEKTIGLCIEKAQRAFREMGIVGEVVVADNGSSDGSVAISESLGARVVMEACKGYGSALMAGIAATRGSVVVMADADDSYDWTALGDFVKKIEEGYDLVMGNRFKGGIEPGAMPALHRYLGNPVLSTLARVMYRIPVADFHCGMRAFTREAFDRMSVRTTGMEFATEMIVNASHAGLRIAEIPTRLYPDKRDRAPHLRFMLNYAPDWLYLAPGLVMAILGLAGMALLARGPIAVGGFSMGIHFLAIFSLLAMLGTNVVGFGVFAKLVNKVRCPIPYGSILGRLLRVFTLERGLLAGLSLMLGGFAVNVAILVEWLARGRGGMTETVHLAFMATTVIVLGVNLMFGAFLLYLLQDNSAEAE